MANKLNLNTSKSNIIKQLSTMHAVDIVNEIYDLDEEQRLMVIQILPLDLVDNVFIELEEEQMADFFYYLDDVRRRHLLTDLSANDLKPMYELLDEDQKNQLLKFLTIEKQTKLEKLMKYDITFAASIMRDNYVHMNDGLIVSEAMNFIISKVEDTDLIDTIFITKDSKLVGTISLKDLIVARKNDEVDSITNRDIHYIYDEDKLIDAIDVISNYDLQVLPVINKDNVLLGIITADDVLEEMALEHESSIDKFVAVGEFDEDSSPFKRAYQRLPWLLVSIILNLVIAMFLSIFSPTIDKVSVLILFQPLILGMAGNIGTQAIAVTILKIQKNDDDNYKTHINKEIMIGIVNAIIIGILGFFLSWAFLALSSFDTANISNSMLSLVIGLSLALSMFISAMFGVFIPLILTRFKIDPAAASGPVISTVNDLVALLIYFGLATLIIIPLIS